jgi:hypothetical protein
MLHDVQFYSVHARGEVINSGNGEQMSAIFGAQPVTSMIVSIMNTTMVHGLAGGVMKILDMQ